MEVLLWSAQEVVWCVQSLISVMPVMLVTFWMKVSAKAVLLTACFARTPVINASQGMLLMKKLGSVNLAPKTVQSVLLMPVLPVFRVSMWGKMVNVNHVGRIVKNARRLVLVRNVPPDILYHKVSVLNVWVVVVVVPWMILPNALVVQLVIISRMIHVRDVLSVVASVKLKTTVRSAQEGTFWMKWL